VNGSGPLVIGHRGAPGYLPEHTAASFALAIAQGVDAIEVDVVASADGVPIVRHERELGGTTDVGGRPEFAARRREGMVDGRHRTGWFAEDFTWAEIESLRARERMPRLRIASAVHDGEAPVLRLSEVAAIAAASDVLLVVELKEARLSAELGLPLPAIVAAELGDLPRPPAVVLESFERSPLLELRGAGLPWPIVYLLDDHGRAADAQELGRSYATELADPAGLQVFDGVSLPTTLITRGRTALLHSFGLDVWTWTLRPENRFLEPPHRRGTAPGAHGDWVTPWSQLLAAGVDGVFVDHPDLAVGLMESALPMVGSA
jgi:glycerophosphoryl diester phosphodiesterase